MEGARYEPTNHSGAGRSGCHHQNPAARSAECPLPVYCGRDGSSGGGDSSGQKHPSPAVLQ